MSAPKPPGSIKGNDPWIFGSLGGLMPFEFKAINMPSKTPAEIPVVGHGTSGRGMRLSVVKGPRLFLCLGPRQGNPRLYGLPW